MWNVHAGVEEKIDSILRQALLTLGRILIAIQPLQTRDDGVLENIHVFRIRTAVCDGNDEKWAAQLSLGLEFVID